MKEQEQQEIYKMLYINFVVGIKILTEDALSKTFNVKILNPKNKVTVSDVGNFVIKNKEYDTFEKKQTLFEDKIDEIMKFRKENQENIDNEFEKIMRYNFNENII